MWMMINLYQSSDRDGSFMIDHWANRTSFKHIDIAKGFPDYFLVVPILLTNSGLLSAICGMSLAATEHRCPPSPEAGRVLRRAGHAGTAGSPILLGCDAETCGFLGGPWSILGRREAEFCTH